jgi:glycine cleavage system aminomethyltransferase T
MKKHKSEVIKSARKTVRKNIEAGIIAHLKDITAKIGPVSKKLAKVIDKGSQKLAKQIAKEIVLLKPTTVEAAPAPITPAARPVVTTKKAPVAKPAVSKIKAVK